jgi:hypothetical protein
MATLDPNQILARILYKLVNNRCFRKGHMLEERIVSAVPAHEKGQAKAILKDAVRSKLILIYGKTNQGTAYQINLERIDEIQALIKEHFVQR